MYQAFYRKHRPKSFSDVTGQEHITDTLKRQITTDRLSHAYLFVGTRGTGKTTCAKILSRAVNCLAPIYGDPCNECKSCVGIESGSILDVLELDAASNNGVDNVRALREEAVYTPASVSKRVYIVDEVHMLSTAAFNALLKILEEPPEHLIFILATTELHKVPATILSRCQRFSFKRLSVETIAARLSLVAEKENITLSEEAAEKLASLADGSMRDGLSLLDQCASDPNIDLAHVLDTIGLTGQAQLLELADAIADRNSTSALSILDGLYCDGKDIASLLNELTTLFRDLLVFDLSPDSPLLSKNFGKAELSKLSAKIPPQRLFASLNVVRDSIFGLSRSGNMKLSAEMCLIRLCDERLSDDSAAILARVVRLESQPVVHVSETVAKIVPQPLENNKSDKFSPEETVADAKSFDDTAEFLIPPAIHEEDVPPEFPTEDAPKNDEAPLSESDFANDNPIPDEPASPEIKPASNAASDDAFWQDILEHLKDDIAVHSLLSDNTEVSASLQDSTLTVHARNPFTVAQIESDMFAGAIKSAAAKVLGREVLLRACAPGGVVEASKHDKLEKLVDSFGIVNYE